jgi:hypothetical protein
MSNIYLEDEKNNNNKYVVEPILNTQHNLNQTKQDENNEDSNIKEEKVQYNDILQKDEIDASD